MECLHYQAVPLSFHNHFFLLVCVSSLHECGSKIRKKKRKIKTEWRHAEKNNVSSFNKMNANGLNNGWVTESEKQMKEKKGEGLQNELATRSEHRRVEIYSRLRRRMSLPLRENPNPFGSPALLILFFFFVHILSCAVFFKSSLLGILQVKWDNSDEPFTEDARPRLLTWNGGLEWSVKRGK